METGKTNRRSLLALGLGLTAVAAGWQLWIGRDKPLVFEAIPNLPGWRRIAFEGISTPGGTAANAVFVGLDASETLSPLSPDSLCAALYPTQGKGIPTAVFTDVNCPNCASLEAKLKARSDVLDVNWHDLPLLGPTSENAARAMAAGDLQENGAAFRQTILSSSPGRLRPGVLRQLAQKSGMDAERLLADMDGPAVKANLTNARRAAETLGIWGTPGFTIGRTFVLGDMREDVIDQLVLDETKRTGC